MDILSLNITVEFERAGREYDALHNLELKMKIDSLPLESGSSASVDFRKDSRTGRADFVMGSIPNQSRSQTVDGEAVMQIWLAGELEIEKRLLVQVI